MEAVECGAAALCSVLAYFGRHVPLARLRAETGVSRNGSNALSLVKVARTYGLKARGARCEPAGLMQLELPLIVFWNFNHFVVLEGYSDRCFYLNDPATGPRRVTHEEFNSSFTGVAITLERSPEFRKGGRRSSLLGSLRQRLSGCETGLLCILVASLALVLPGLVIPSFIRIFVDDLMGRHRHEWILWLLLAMGVTALVNSLLTWLKQYFLARLETRLAMTSSARFVWHVLRLPVEFYTQRYAGEISSRVALNDRVASLLTGELASAATNGIMIVFYGVVMYCYDAVLTGIAVGLAVASFVTLTMVSRQRVDCNQRLLQDGGKLTGTTTGGLQTIETLKATGRESDFFTRWAGCLSRVVNAQQELSLSSQVLAVVPALLSGLGTVAILSVGGLRVMEGAMTIGMLVAFQFLMANFLGPVGDMVQYGSQLQEAVGNIHRLDDVLANQPHVEGGAAEAAHAARLARLSGHLELRNVTFGYCRLEPALIEGFSLTVRPGQRVALVGATGSGKSTISRLVCGVHAPWSGEILFDGVPRDQVPRAVLTSSLAQVDQEIVLFAGTVRENLSLWDATLADSRLVQALSDAHLDRVVLERPGGLDSPVDNSGSNFSGGERQRLEIARALVGDPTLLVLDEATSALDPLVEKAVDRNLRRRGCTCLIVAHRLSTIRDCDEIIVLRAGKVVQRGTHDELAAVEGAYRSLMEAEVAPGPGRPGRLGAPS